MKTWTEKKKGEKGKTANRRFHFCPPLPHAWEFEGWPGDEIHRAGCELRRSPGLAGEFGHGFGPWARPSRDPAWLFPFDLERSAKRFVAVTCAVSIPPYSRASAT